MSQTDHSRSRVAKRIGVSVGVAIVAGAIPFAYHAAGATHTDFDQIWIAARALMHRDDPYRAVAAGFLWPFYYPLPAALIGLPFALAPKLWAAAVWTAVGFGLLAFSLTEKAWWPLVGLLSYPALDAARLAQWSPILTAMALLPALSWLAVGKPSTGGGVALAYLPKTLRWTSVAMGLVLIAVAFLIDPPWFEDWRTALATAHHLVPMVARPGGFVLLLALFRWRRPEARLLAALALVPQTAYPYEALPMILALRARWEALVWAFATLVGAWFLHQNASSFTAMVANNAPMILASSYIPVLVMVLRRKNTSS